MDDLFEHVPWVAVGMGAGLAAAVAQRHPRRLLGLLPLGLSGVAAALVVGRAAALPAWFAAAPSLAAGLVPLPLAALLDGGPDRGRARFRRPLRATLVSFTLAVLFAAILLLAHSAAASHVAFWPATALFAAGALVAWLIFVQQAMEQVAEVILWPIHRVRAAGPGLDRFPRRGPLIVIANHAAWFDPVWLGKVLPRRLFPMMTSRFYDVWPATWFFRAVRAIRVQASRYRPEAPELREGIAVLDRGGCLVLFPEGHMRHYENRPLSHFGQGIWHILSQRPATPVVVCWIEGGWGSFCSYWNGKPTRNKRPDFWRPIKVAVSEPVVLDAELLKDRRATRLYLMERCRAARKLLGLPPHPMPEHFHDPERGAPALQTASSEEGVESK